MSYLVCFECNQYYEVESLDDAADMELTHCECGRELVYFENLEDAYPETSDYINEEQTTEVDEAYEPTTEEYVDNSLTFTEEKVIQYRSESEKGTQLIYTGMGVLVLGLITGLFFNYIFFILVFLGGFLAVYGNSMNENAEVEGYKWEKGLEGEYIVENHLNSLPSDYRVFNDVKLHGKGRNIDHITIGPTGIFVIETKNYSGKYRIKDEDWFYIKNGRYIKLKKDPGLQARRNTMDLINFLNQRGHSTKKIWITSLVAFICPDFRVQETPKTYKVLLPKTVPKYILNQTKVTDLELMDKAVFELESLNV